MTAINRARIETFQECEELLLEMASEAEACRDATNTSRANQAEYCDSKARSFRRIAAMIAERKRNVEKAE